MTNTNKYSDQKTENHFYFVETCEKFQQNATTENGCDSLHEVYEYLTSLGYPEYVKDSAIQNMQFDDTDYRIKISLLKESRPTNY